MEIHGGTFWKKFLTDIFILSNVPNRTPNGYCLVVEVVGKGIVFINLCMPEAHGSGHKNAMT